MAYYIMSFKKREEKKMKEVKSYLNKKYVYNGNMRVK